MDARWLLPRCGVRVGAHESKFQSRGRGGSHGSVDLARVHLRHGKLDGARSERRGGFRGGGGHDGVEALGHLLSRRLLSFDHRPKARITGGGRALETIAYCQSSKRVIRNTGHCRIERKIMGAVARDAMTLFVYFPTHLGDARQASGTACHCCEARDESKILTLGNKKCLGFEQSSPLSHPTSTLR